MSVDIRFFNLPDNFLTKSTFSSLREEFRSGAPAMFQNRNILKPFLLYIISELNSDLIENNLFYISRISALHFSCIPNRTTPYNLQEMSVLIVRAWSSILSFEVCFCNFFKSYIFIHYSLCFFLSVSTLFYIHWLVSSGWFFKDFWQCSQLHTVFKDFYNYTSSICLVLRWRMLRIFFFFFSIDLQI